MPTSLKNTIGGGGAGFKLAPDLNYLSSGGNIKTINGIDGSLGFTTALSLSGKFAVPHLKFEGTSSEQVSVRLTIDGAIIIDDTFNTDANGISIFGGALGSGVTADLNALIPVVETHLLLEISTTTDSDVRLVYNARPII